MFWLTAFLDLPADGYDEGVTFWERVTGFERSAARGPEGEFASLVPPRGDAHLRVQRRRLGHSRVHLDVHVEDPQAAADDALTRGAVVGLRHDLGYVVMRSPGGFTFCFVGHPGDTPADPSDWGDGLTSAVDQVCLDIPAAHYESEVAFWEWLTGWERRISSEHDEFQRLIRPADRPLQILLQRLGEPDGTTRAHLDLATSDRERETQRHVDLGAEVVQVFKGWTVMRDPVGTTYCITGRHTGTRVLDQPPYD